MALCNRPSGAVTCDIHPFAPSTLPPPNHTARYTPAVIVYLTPPEHKAEFSLSTCDLQPSLPPLLDIEQGSTHQLPAMMDSEHDRAPDHFVEKSTPSHFDDAIWSLHLNSSEFDPTQAEELLTMPVGHPDGHFHAMMVASPPVDPRFPGVENAAL